MEQSRGHQGGASCIQKSLMDISDQPLRLLKRSLKIHWEALLIRQTQGVCSLNCSALGQNCREKIEHCTSYQSRAFVPLTLQRNGCKRSFNASRKPVIPDLPLSTQKHQQASADIRQTLALLFPSVVLKISDRFNSDLSIQIKEIQHNYFNKTAAGSPVNFKDLDKTFWNSRMNFNINSIPLIAV